MNDIIVDDGILVQVIDLSDNQFRSLEDVPEFLKRTSGLHFDSNSIQEVSPDFMSHMEQLELLDLSRNQMKMSANMFEPLKNLQELFLYGNNLGTIKPDWFTGLTKLKKLYIGSNGLSTFDYISLVNTLPALKRLNIQGGVSHFKCSYLKDMVKDLKAVNRVDVLIHNEYVLEEDEDFIYDIRCERDAADTFSESYLKGNYGI